MSNCHKMSVDKPNSSDEEGKRKLDEWAKRQSKIWTNVQENHFKRKHISRDRQTCQKREKGKGERSKKQKEKEPKKIN